MSKKKNDSNFINVRKGATLREIYAQLRAEYAEMDSQKLEDEYRKAIAGPQVPMEQLLRELDEINAKEKAKLNRRKKSQDKSASYSKKKK